jgi:hypothetical protein
MHSASKAAGAPSVHVTSLKIIKGASFRSLSLTEGATVLGAALHRTVGLSEVATAAALTAAKPSKAGFAALGALGPESVYYGPAGDLFLGDPHIAFAPSKQFDSVLEISLFTRAKTAYLFDVSVTPVQARVAATGTFQVTGAGKVAPSAPDQTDTVQIPAASNASAPVHLGFVVTASGTGHVILFVKSPDSSWQLNRCDISSAAQ